METTRTRYIDPLTDFGFKHLFGSEPNKEILIAFLNALFEGEKVITDLSYGSTERNGENPKEKKVFFDLHCTGENGEKFVIEMQRTEQHHFKDRCVFYMSRLVSGLLPKGGSPWDSPLPEVYLISIMEFAFNDISVSYLRNVKLIDSDEQGVFYNGMGYKFLVLPNFVKKEEELVTETDKWFYLLKNLGRLNKIPHFLDKRVFQLLFNIAEMSNLTKEQQELYDSDLKAKSAYHGGIQFAADKAAKEAAEKAAKDNSKLIAGKMKLKGMSINEIIELTNLSSEEIEKL